MTIPDRTLIEELEKSGEFDGEWYRREFRDVEMSGLSSAEHYILIGKQLGRRPNSGSAEAPSREGISNTVNGARYFPPFESFGIIRHNPLISILIVSYNSGRDLKVLLPTIARQTYRNIEVVLIENGVEDTEPLLKQHIACYRFERADNVGFAEGNNKALRHASGELIALINPDTKLAPDMIQNLLDSLRFDSHAAAAIPKILFFERFIRVTIQSNASFAVSREDLVAGLDYQKLFVRVGTDDGLNLVSDAAGVLEVDMPYTGPRSVQCVLKANENVGLYRGVVQIGYSGAITTVSNVASEIYISLNFDDEHSASARPLVNNAGSSLRSDGSPFDRGFAEFDDGAFFAKAYVDALCGCAALIRRVALIERELFCGPFFAYYEDSELSFSLRKSGYRILYQPDSIVYHRHSETTEENSQLWKVLVGRSRKLYDMAVGRELLPPRYFEFEYPKNFHHPLHGRLSILDEKVRTANDMAHLSRPNRPTACIYNSYFSSMGGGERHALELISLIIERYDVYIACEEDFSIADLENYFSVNLSGARKIISTNIDSHFSSKFDLFINSTYRSNLISYAKKNYYIVSFPHEDLNEALLDETYFLHNSTFTAKWANKYWGRHRGSVVLPIIGQGSLFNEDGSAAQKSKVFLSVGRFTAEGHCKNHHKVLEAYRHLVDSSPECASWQLRIIGSCSIADSKALSYLQLLRELAEGYNVEILPNAPHEILRSAYQDAAIYIHATGLGLDATEPEKHEHFGIAPFEAIAHGCIPIVYAIGGPSDQVQSMAEGFTFADFAELIDVMKRAMANFVNDTDGSSKIIKKAFEMYQRNKKIAEQIF